MFKNLCIKNMNNTTLNIEGYLSKLNIGLASLKLIYDNHRKPTDIIIKDVNESFEKIIGFSKEEIIGKKYSDIDNKINERIIGVCNKAIQNNSKEIVEYYENINKKYFTVSLFPEQQDLLTAVFQDNTDIARLEQKNKRIKNIIRASRIINKLILKEKALSVLLKKSCEIIAISVNSPEVWITLLHKNTRLIKDTYSSNNEVDNVLNTGKKITPCMKQVLEHKKAKIYMHTLEDCNSCWLKNKQNHTPQLIVPLNFNNHIYGLLNIKFNSELYLEKTELQYFENIANDLAYYNFNIEIKDDLEIARKKVREYYKEIDNQNKKLLELNKLLNLKNVQLELTKEKAQESERLKSAFLSNVSHELRTPLNGILGFTQLIKQPNYSLENIKDYLEIIHQSGNNLLDAINSILDISKIESNQLSVHLHDCNVKKIISDCVLNYKKKEFELKRVQLKTQTINLSDDLSFLCDEDKLKQILDILIGNAIKFTKKGEISTGASIEDNNIIFFVKDTGIGIESEKFESIFENFIQADDTNTREFGGIGLGLPIAKGLVNILNGDIWLESEPGKGSTFYIKIPYVLNKNKTEKENHMDLKKINNLDWSSKKILIVEDDIFSAEYLAEALGITNVNIIFAKNGNEAIKMVRENPDIDVILMDIQLPDLSGDKATSIIRESNVDIPIIAQTAHAMINDKDNYINAGCTDYISKPISINELFTVISKYI